MKTASRLTVTLIFVLFISSLATGQTRFKSLNYLYSISGNNILSGQHNDQKPFHGELTGASYWTDEVYEVTGKYPGLYGADLLFHGSSSKRWEITYEAVKQWNKGAVISVMWHACPPTQDEPCQWNGGILSSLDDAQWTDLLTDGGTLNTEWKSRMDDIAAPYLQYLEDQGVEVMWRPFHEQNQTLFWWNSGGAENTKALWKLTHDYMSNDLGLSNLIWVWDVQDIHDKYAQYNPGDEYFDVAALDVYSDGYTNLKYYNSLVDQADGKPVAIGECFKLPTASVINNQPLMSFFMTWAYGLYETDGGAPTNSTQEIINTYNNPKVITLDEMPGWLSYCAYDGLVAPVPGLIEAENFGICGEGESYLDSDTINVPGYYRDDTGVDIDTSQAGGYCISDIVAGEWTEYPVEIEATATFTLEMGLASDMENRKFHVELNGVDISGPINVPHTGGLMNWDTISVPLGLLSAGQKALRVVMDSGSFSIDFLEFFMENIAPYASITSPEDKENFELDSDITISVDAGDPDGEIAMVEYFEGSEKIGELTSEPFDFVWENVPVGHYAISAFATDNEGLSVATDTVGISVYEKQGPFHGTPFAIPGKIECEDYDFGGEGVSFHELTPGNKFNEDYRGDDPVDVGGSDDDGGGYQIGDFQDGEWLNYSIDVAESALYDIEIRYGTEMEGSSLSLKIDDQSFSGRVSTPGTGGWSVFTTLTVEGKALSEGEHFLTLYCSKGYQNVNWINLTESTVGVDNAHKAGTSQLSRIYPNPFSHSTSISYQLAENSNVEMKIYDIMGIQVRTLVDQQQDAGSHKVSFYREDLSTGIYFVRLVIGQQTFQRKVELF